MPEFVEAETGGHAGQTESDRKEMYDIKRKSAPAMWERAD